MTFDPRNPPPWLAKLGLAMEGHAKKCWPQLPSEGLLAACRLSDDVQAFSRACFDALHPHLDSQEKIHAFVKQRDAVRYAKDRFFQKFQTSSS